MKNCRKVLNSRGKHIRIETIGLLCEFSFHSTEAVLKHFFRWQINHTTANKDWFSKNGYVGVPHSQHPIPSFLGILSFTYCQYRADVKNEEVDIKYKAIYGEKLQALLQECTDLETRYLKMDDQGWHRAGITCPTPKMSSSASSLRSHLPSTVSRLYAVSIWCLCLADAVSRHDGWGSQLVVPFGPSVLSLAFTPLLTLPCGVALQFLFSFHYLCWFCTHNLMFLTRYLEFELALFSSPRDFAFKPNSTVHILFYDRFSF